MSSVHVGKLAINRIKFGLVGRIFWTLTDKYLKMLFIYEVILQNC